jgi:hypothetical protein
MYDRDIASIYPYSGDDNVALINGRNTSYTGYVPATGEDPARVVPGGDGSTTTLRVIATEDVRIPLGQLKIGDGASNPDSDNIALHGTFTTKEVRNPINPEAEIYISGDAGIMSLDASHSGYWGINGNENNAEEFIVQGYNVDVNADVGVYPENGFIGTYTKNGRDEATLIAPELNEDGTANFEAQRDTVTFDIDFTGTNGADFFTGDQILKDQYGEEMLLEAEGVNLPNYNIDDFARVDSTNEDGAHVVTFRRIGGSIYETDTIITLTGVEWVNDGAGNRIWIGAGQEPTATTE